MKREYRRLDQLCGVDTSHVPIKVTKAVKRIGCCVTTDGPLMVVEFRLGEILFRQPEQFFFDVIRHEYAHALVKLRRPKERHGHDGVWKKACLEVGCQPSRCYIATKSIAKARIKKRGSFKYRVTCNVCEQETMYFRAGPVIRALLNDPHSCTCPYCKSKDFVVHTLK